MRETSSQQYIEQKNAIEQQRTLDVFFIDDMLAQRRVELYDLPFAIGPGLKTSKIARLFQKRQVSRRGWIERARENDNSATRHW